MPVPKPPRHWLISPGPWRVLIIDDGAPMRQYLARRVETEPEFIVCGDAPASVQAPKAVARFKPDLIIAGLDTLGMRHVAEAVSRWQSIPVLVLSTCDETECAEAALRAGAKGFLSLREIPEHLPGALRRILRGQIYLNEQFAGEIAAKKRFNEAVALLSDDERTWLIQLGSGRAETSATREAALLSKLQIDSRSELTHLASQWVREGVK